MQRVFIIHGWKGHPGEGWFPWLEKELRGRGIHVETPFMLDADRPMMDAWVQCLKEAVHLTNRETFFVGHSLGCQAILRYLQGLPSTVKLGGAVFVAGFERLGGKFQHSREGQIALGPWLQEPIHWESIRGRMRNFVAIFSDNDEWVPIDNVGVFDRKLGAQTLVLHKRGHFSGSEGTLALPEALDALLEMMGLPARSPSARSSHISINRYIIMRIIFSA